MRRPFKSFRLVGPLFATEEPQEIEQELRDLGIERIRVDKHQGQNFTSISFFMLGQDPDEMFGSVIEVNRDNELVNAQLRAPTFTSTPGQQGLSVDEYERVQENKTLDLWGDISEDILRIVDEETDVDYVMYENGEVFTEPNRDINVRTQDGHKFKNITPHIEFLGQDLPLDDQDKKSKISLEELYNVIDRINQLFLGKYSDIELVSRQEA